MTSKRFAGTVVMIALQLGARVFAQSPTPLVQPQGAAGAPIVMTLPEALDRARKLDALFLGATADARLAAEDRIQARAAFLPSVRATVQDLVTQGNGTFPSGRFVSNDGIHMYRGWAVVHQDLSVDTLLQTGYKRAAAAEAVAKAKIDLARFGIEGAVTTNYYALITAQRKYATAQQLVQYAQRFFETSQQRERLGQAARADVIKAELQYQLQKQNFDDLTLAMDSARLNLAVMLFPALNENFTVVDDLDTAHALPPFPEIQSMGLKQNPDLRIATLSLDQTGFDVTAAKHAFLPAVTIDADYGIEANAFKLHSTNAADPSKGPMPNLGFFITASMNMPVWDWGLLKSKVSQAQIRRKQAEAQLSQAQRQLAGKLYSSYNEALAAQSAVTTMRHAAELATESLRLTNLRYQAGESTAQEVVDAQNALVGVRNAYDDSQARYRLAISGLQLLTGGF